MASIEAYYGQPAITVRANATAAEAGRLMTERRVGAVVVVDESGAPVVSPREHPARCSELMKRTGARHLLVRDGKRLAGVVSMRDVIRALLDEREAEVRHLTGYITGIGG